MERLVNSINNLLSEVKKEKLRNTIKVEILNNLDYIKTFITSSPGLISPSIVSNKIKEIRQYLKVWIKNTNLVSELEKVFIEVENRYITLVEDNDDSPLVNEKPIEVIPATIPSRTKKLFKDVELQRGDVSYLPVGPCCHYCIVYKIIDDTCLVIPITSSGGHLGFGYDIEKSRFFKGTVLYSLSQFPISMVVDGFTMPYDSIGELRKIFKGFEEKLRSILPKPRKPYKRK